MFNRAKSEGASDYSLRASIKTLDALLIKSGGLEFDDGHLKKDMAMNNANANVLDAMSNEERDRYETLSPYGKDEFKMALELQFLRQQMVQLEDMEDKNKQATIMGRGNPPHSRQEMSKASQDIRKRIQKLNQSAQGLQRNAKNEGKVEEAKEVLRHMEGTKGMFKKKFAVAHSSYAGPEDPMMGDETRGSLNKEMDLNQLDQNAGEIRESIRDDAEFQQFFMKVSERDAQIDKLVDDISKGTRRLRNQAIGIQEELTKQNEILKETEEKVDDISAKTKTLNRKLKDTIKKVDEDKMCIYALCFVLLLGLLGYLLYELGVFGGKNKK